MKVVLEMGKRRAEGRVFGPFQRTKKGKKEQRTGKRETAGKAAEKIFRGKGGNREEGSELRLQGRVSLCLKAAFTAAAGERGERTGRRGAGKTLRTIRRGKRLREQGKAI